MSAANAQEAQELNAPRRVILFVDDEPRVLKSMRAMFRRDYDVKLANSGAEALELVASNKIDVVVSDQRMPEMTGVEVLTEIKARSPQTVRILLTGYADLAAVEASINEAEVFKYLMKPCPADEVRGAVREGLEIFAGADALAPLLQIPSEPPPLAAARETAEPTVAEPAAAARLEQRTRSVEVLVISNDKTLIDGVREACPTHTLHHANSLDRALPLIRNHPIGVLVTDVAVDQQEIRELSVAVKQVTPEMVIILASDRSDANVLIQLINSGQVFRFLLKPLHIGQCRIWLASGLRRFVESGSQALAALDPSAAKQSHWVRFRDWFLGMEG